MAKSPCSRLCLQSNWSKSIILATSQKFPILPWRVCRTSVIPFIRYGIIKFSGRVREKSLWQFLGSPPKDAAGEGVEIVGRERSRRQNIKEVLGKGWTRRGFFFPLRVQFEALRTGKRLRSFLYPRMRPHIRIRFGRARVFVPVQKREKEEKERKSFALDDLRETFATLDVDRRRKSWRSETDFVSTSHGLKNTRTSFSLSSILFTENSWITFCLKPFKHFSTRNIYKQIFRGGKIISVVRKQTTILS